MKRRLSTVLCLLSLLALPAWARYIPNLDTITDLGDSTAFPANKAVSLTKSEYKVTGSLTFTEPGSDSQMGALRVDASQVTIWMTDGASLTLHGATASNGKGGGAGIYLPSGKTLIFRLASNGEKASASVSAYGGTGADAKKGGDGVNGCAWADGGYGAGGNGGCGAYGPGAGIGGNGGNGGAGGNGPAGATSPSGGNKGEDGDDGCAAGTLWVGEGILLEAKPGEVGKNNANNTSGGNSWSGGAGGGGGAGSGGGSGTAPSIGGGAAGGGGGGGGGGANNKGGSGGGGGGQAGGRGYGGANYGSNKSGGVGSIGGDETGGAGGTGGASNGGAGGDQGAGGGAGIVYYATGSTITSGNMSRKYKGDGYPSTLTNTTVTLDWNTFGLANSDVQKDPDALILADSAGKLWSLPVQPPYVEGYSFMGYYTTKNTSGTKMINADGTVVSGKALPSGQKTLYAVWSVCSVEKGTATAYLGAATNTIGAKVTLAPESHVTYGSWWVLRPGADEYEVYIAQCPADPVKTGEIVPDVSALENLGDGSPSGEYKYVYRLVSIRDGNGLVATNDSEIVSITYIQRDTPEFDEERKILWANGSALLLKRDTREKDRVVCYYDRYWSGAYGEALLRGTDLSKDGFWVNGGFRDGSQVGGGVRVNFESGTIYGLDAGTNNAPGIERSLTIGADATVGAGGTTNWVEIIK